MPNVLIAEYKCVIEHTGRISPKAIISSVFSKGCLENVYNFSKPELSRASANNIKIQNSCWCVRKYSFVNLRTSSEQSSEYTDLDKALASIYCVCIVNFASSMNPSIVVKMCNPCYCKKCPILSPSNLKQQFLLLLSCA